MSSDFAEIQAQYMNTVRLAAAGFSTEKTEHGAAEHDFSHCVDDSASFFFAYQRGIQNDEEVWRRLPPTSKQKGLRVFVLRSLRVEARGSDTATPDSSTD